ncbi:MAG TPA: response regulator transcription factor [Candidatus Saccharimonadales bacterium]|nr:response regulator transcription factor [Candidatus Saccharimonadales bacterium]
MSNKSVSILIVDDHETTRSALSLLISSCLAVVDNSCAVATAEEALLLLQSMPFHLALVDIRLPGASGLDLSSLIRREYPNTVVILVSGVTNLLGLKGQLQGGWFDCVDKSASVQELKDSIQRALDYQEKLAAY